MAIILQALMLIKYLDILSKELSLGRPAMSTPTRPLAERIRIRDASGVLGPLFPEMLIEGIKSHKPSSLVSQSKDPVVVLTHHQSGGRASISSLALLSGHSKLTSSASLWTCLQ